MKSTAIQHLRAFRVWDSRGRPTVEVEIILRDGTLGRGIAPAGLSRGSREAVDVRDAGSVDGGFGVSRAVGNVNGPIAGALIGMDVLDQSACDARLLELDPTPTKEQLGGNAIVATSMAVLAAAANSQKLPVWRYLAGDAPVRMPLPQVQIFGGGAHASRRTDIQDFLAMPVGAGTFDEALSLCADVYRAAGELMERKGKRFGVADEGGWWPDFDSNEEALETLTAAIETAGHADGAVKIALDVAASEFGKAGAYQLGLEGRVCSTDEWIAQLSAWIKRFPIISVEDPVAEDDMEGMQRFSAAMGKRVQIIGDDFLVTNAALIERAAAAGACNAVLLKPNQAGTLTETRAALESARRASWSTVVSARSGETEDVLVTHLAVGWNAGQLKVGSFARSERMAKWNEGLRIERGGHGLVSGFAGAGALPVRVD